MNLDSTSNGRAASAARLSRLFCCLAALLLQACAIRSTYIHPEAGHSDVPANADSIQTTLLLIGDAGKPRPIRPEPVLQALSAEAALAPEQTVVVFLGDIVYPKGIAPRGHRDYPRTRRVLLKQVAAIQDAGARAVFVPGNHDYKGKDPARLRRMHAILDSLQSDKVEMLPGDVCPGPAIRDYGDWLRLVILDTTWWLEDEKSRAQTVGRCARDEEHEIVAALEQSISTSGQRHCVVVAHHPLQTNGRHGGFFPWSSHLFPLREFNKNLWIPLPLLGSAYIWARQSGVAAQDLSSGEYENFIENIEAGLADAPPLLYASGHEHNLQFLKGKRNVPFHLVSGVGSLSRFSDLTHREDTLFASPRAGFARVDFLLDGRVRLEFIEVLAEGGTRRPYATWLRP